MKNLPRELPRIQSLDRVPRYPQPSIPVNARMVNDCHLLARVAALQQRHSSSWPVMLRLPPGSRTLRWGPGGGFLRHMIRAHNNELRSRNHDVGTIFERQRFFTSVQIDSGSKGYDCSQSSSTRLCGGFDYSRRNCCGLRVEPSARSRRLQMGTDGRLPRRRKSD